MQVDQDKKFSVRHKFKPAKEICGRIDFWKSVIGIGIEIPHFWRKIPVQISIISLFFRVQSLCQKSGIIMIFQVLEDFLIKKSFILVYSGNSIIINYITRF